MSGTVVVNSSFVLPAGQAAIFSSPVYDPSGAFTLYTAGYLLKPVGGSVTAQPVTFTDAGAISVSDNIYAGVTGIEDINSSSDPTTAAAFAAGSWVTITSTGTLSVTDVSSARSTLAVGYDSAWGYVSFENDGTVTATTSGGTAYGVEMARSVSQGVPGVTPAAQVPNPQVVNRGLIQVTGAFGAGVELGTGATLTNSGVITGRGGALGVIAGSLAGQGTGLVTIVNSNQITSTAGIGIVTLGTFTGYVDITNSGTITGTEGIKIVGSPVGGAILTLHNTGTVNGAVDVQQASLVAGKGGAQVYNSGAIIGDVKLLDGGDDLYDGRGGTLSGTLTLGNGLNLVYLGNDGETVQAGSGLNVVYGGSGGDVFNGGSGLNTFIVGGGNDVLDGGSGGVNMLSFARAASAGVTVDLSNLSQQHTGFGWDTISHFQNVTGTAFADQLTGDGGNNILDAGSGGNDVMDGGGGRDLASFQHATAGVTVNLASHVAQNTIGAGTDTLTNFEGLVGSHFDDHLTGDGGSNLISGGTGGNDVLDGGNGTNNTVSFAYALNGVTVSLAAQDQYQTTGAGADWLTHFQNILGSSYDDVLSGDANDNIIDGYLGTNTVSYAAASAAVTIDLQNGTATGAGSGHDTLTSIQSAIGSNYNDYIYASAFTSGRYDGGGGVNTLDLSHGALGMAIDLSAGVAVDGNRTLVLANVQKLIGTSLNDRIVFGTGSVTVSGGAGADTFVPTSAAAEEIKDFTASQGDKIDLSVVHSLHSLAQLQGLATQSGSSTIIDLGNGGSLTLDNVALSSLTADNFIFSAVPGDFLGTGHASLFWQNAVNNLTSAWLLTDAAPANGVSLPAVAGWQTYDVGNFEGGGYGGDFLLRNTTTGMVNIWQDNNGVMSGHDVDKATLDWQIMGAVDFNADGKSDVLWRNEENGYVSVWQMNGSHVDTTYNPGVVGLQWKLVGANDFVGDGKAEVLWRDSGSGEVNLWTIDGPGAGQTHGQTVAYLGNEWNVAGTGDFNGDGKADILWFDTVTGQVVVWEMNGASVLAHQEIGDPGPQWRVVDVADISGDGKTDILWRDTGTGQVVAWAMDGFHVDHYGVLATVDNTWKVINHHYDLA